MSRQSNIFNNSAGFSFLTLCFLFSFFHSKSQILTADAGGDTLICKYDTTTIGGNPSATGGTPPYTYSWIPVFGLNSPAAANPSAFPTAPESYTLTVTDSLGAVAIDVVSITHLPLPVVDAGPDQTISSGTYTTLQASGAINYFWSPVEALENQNTATPTAEPGSTTTYCVAGVDSNGCVNYDCMVLEVTPSDTVIIYNGFTPNGDGANDVLYIGNLSKFPDNKIEVFNRNGKLVYRAAPYKNDWDGKIEGADIPSATYYIVLDLGSEKGKATGAVTIIR